MIKFNGGPFFSPEKSRAWPGHRLAAPASKRCWYVRFSWNRVMYTEYPVKNQSSRYLVWNRTITEIDSYIYIYIEYVCNQKPKVIVIRSENI